MPSRALTELSIANSPQNKGKAKTSVGYETADETSARARALLSSINSASSVNSEYRGGNVETDITDVTSGAESLSNAIGSADAFNERKNTIMETYRDRRSLAKEGGEAQRGLIDENSEAAIQETLRQNANEYINAIEGRSGFGTKSAAVKFMEESGSKRVRDLEKRRDSLLLESKVQEAARLDNLIAVEQEAITQARTSFVNEIMGISQEGRALAADERAARSFETPEEQRAAEIENLQRTLEIEDVQLQAQAVRELSLMAPDANITAQDSYEQAVAKYRNSETYARNERAAELELESIEADIANQRSLAQNRGMSSGSASIATTESGTYSSDLDALIGNASLIAGQSGKFYLEEFGRRINMSRSDADKINTIANVVLQGAPAGIKNDFRNQADGIQNINRAIAMLEEGVQTGAIPATQQYLLNIIGRDYDPEVTEIGQAITAAIQPYRSSITGAAWGRQEDREYENMFGSTKYEPDELLTRLYGLRDILVNKSANALNSQVNPLGTYSNVFQTPLQENWQSDLESGLSGASGIMFDESDL